MRKQITIVKSQLKDISSTILLKIFQITGGPGGPGGPAITIGVAESAGSWTTGPGGPGGPGGPAIT